MSYDKAHCRRQQAAFQHGPVDPKTGNFTKSAAEKAGVKQWPKTKAERNKYDSFMRTW
jgi:hypothetical protein